MKVFTQIPCLNEEGTLPLVLSSIPESTSPDWGARSAGPSASWRG